MNPQVDTKFALLIRLIAILIVGGIFIRAASLTIAPGGYLTIKTNLTAPSPFISEPKPSERLDLVNGTPYRLLDEPIYFDVKPPSDFETVTVLASYLNHEQSVVEIGALANRLDDQYDTRPIENRLIDSLTWKRSTSGRLTLLQRKEIYDSVDDFLANPPDPARVAMYRTTLDWPYRSQAYQSSIDAKIRRVSLRGHHRILTYSGGEPLSFNFSIQDMNRQTGADPVTVSLYREGEQEALARTILVDDGNTNDDQVSSGLRTVAISLADPSPGLYRLEFTASGDIFIRELNTRQNKFVFLQQLYLGDHVGYSDQTSPVTVQVNGHLIIAKTAHNDGLQTLAVDEQKLEIREPHVRYISRLENGVELSNITTTKRDVLIESDGVFALEPEDFFNPLPLELDWYLTLNDLTAAGIDFILTEYEPPTVDGQLTTGQATFEISNLATTERGTYRFAVSAPGIGLTNNDLRLSELVFAFSRRPIGWWQGLRLLLADLGWRITDRETAVILYDGQSFDEKIE
jgi:hypothetical protein